MVGRVLTALLYSVGVALFWTGMAPLVRWLGRRNPKILLYHDCSETESDYVADLECTTSPARFAEHIAYLARHHTIVPLETIVAGDAPMNAVAVTFDDGYASVYQNAFPVLRKYGAPATVYLISSVVGNGTLVWVNELNDLIRRLGPASLDCVRRYFDVPTDATPADVIGICRLKFDATKIEALLDDLRKSTGLPLADHAARAQLYLNWDQIDEMRAAGVEFGNHSRTHPNMERLSEEEQRAEIEGAQRELEAHLPRVRAFAHPFGHRGPATAGLAYKAGLHSAADVGGHNRPVEPLGLGRTHMANEPVAGLFARMEVVEPVKGLLRRRLTRSKAKRGVPHEHRLEAA